MKKSLFLLALLGPLLTAAQEGPTVTVREQLWLGYVGQARLTNHFGLWLDLHHRRTDNFVRNSFVELVRPGATWFVNDNFRISGGYAFVYGHPAEGKNTFRPEHRPWQQIWWRQNYPRVQVVQVLRFEQRFLRTMNGDAWGEGYDHVNRLRFNAMITIALTKGGFAIGKPQLIINNEVMINTGPRTTYNVFDQNRAAIALGVKCTNSLSAQIGYLNIYQQAATGKDHTMTHAIRVFLFQQLDFRKKE